MKQVDRQAKDLFKSAYNNAFEKKRPNWKKAFANWMTAASRGHLRSQFYVGVCYDKGWGVKRDTKTAFAWYMTAAEQGHMESQYNVSFFYKRGEHVRKNYKNMIN